MYSLRYSFKGLVYAQAAHCTALILETALLTTAFGQWHGPAGTWVISKIHGIHHDLISVLTRAVIAWYVLYFVNAILVAMAGFVFVRSARRGQGLDYTTIVANGFCISFAADMMFLPLTGQVGGPILVEDWILEFFITAINGAILGLTYWSVAGVKPIPIIADKPWRARVAVLGSVALYGLSMLFAANIEWLRAHKEASKVIATALPFIPLGAGFLFVLYRKHALERRRLNQGAFVQHKGSSGEED